ncbi:Protein RALF-like 33 [Apostasia shenzhenica]|uniref:Protein RALF-like 33 n=1 Tax=Apostasia shenzhenica TaxID=1088818 RepID=A0A2I0ASB2_9ASPA|nr:Protein RALF-like 33 [Apostasia shenzhenica]
MGRKYSSILLLLLYAAVVTTASASGKGDFHLGWIPMRSECQGMIWQCIGRHEFDLASESGRRILATSDYISYDALKRGSVPCSRRGASYYNCRPGAQANPYSRGCSVITQCRS